MNTGPYSAVCYTLRLFSMNIKELKEIIDFVTSKDSIEELEIEKSGVRLKIKRASSQPVSAISSVPLNAPNVTSVISAPPTPAKISVEGEDLFYIKSPIVGTFYKAP